MIEIIDIGRLLVKKWYRHKRLVMAVDDRGIVLVGSYEDTLITVNMFEQQDLNLGEA